MGVRIKAIEYYLPEHTLTNADLHLNHPEWNINKVGEKSGVYQRHIANQNETALDFAINAIEKLFNSKAIKKDEIDGIVFCTQSPDFIMPSNAFLIHKHFDFYHNVWAFDYNLACSGYIYGLSIVRGMIETNMAKNVLLINADTYSKYINKNDRSASVLFGDGGAVSLITNEDGIIDIKLSASGKEYESFFIPSGGARLPKDLNTKEVTIDRSGNHRSKEDIHMNGFSVWKFISGIVPIQIRELLLSNNLAVKDIDFFGFHQASKLTLDSLIKTLKIDESKVYMNLNTIGNTVSASIPILLKDAEDNKLLKKGDLVLLSGFGVGLSWGSLLMKY